MSDQASPLLKTILNKSIAALAGDGIQQCVINNTVTQRDRFGLHNFIKHNPNLFNGLVLLTVLMIISYIFLWYRNRLQRGYNKQLTAKNQELHKATKAADAFFSQLSHDMRTPMNAILGFTELGLGSHDPKELLDYMGKIRISGQYLLRLINDSLQISRINNNKITTQAEPCTLRELAVVLDDIFREKADRKHVALELDMGPWADKNLLLDKNYVQQILVNLLNNALKFTPKGGTVQLTIDSQKVKEQEFLRFKVKDNGCGMSPDFAANKLYLPFAQENKAQNLKEEEEGTGLGLSIVKHLVEYLKGSIQCESKLQEGTCFTVLLPLVFTEAAAVKPQETQPQVQDLTGKRVLVCEDHPLNMEITVKLLAKQGITTDEAEDGQAGVDKFAASPANYYDAILMDVRMPVMDGLTAAKAIRALARADARTVPILAMTANHSEEDIKQCLAAGMNTYLGKPIEPQKFYAAMQKWLGGPSTPRSR